MNNRVHMGQIGEKIAADHFKLTLSKDVFDRLKDASCLLGKIFEIKTQNRFPSFEFGHLFSIAQPDGGKHINNLMKCCTVDHLIFVEYDNSDIIRLWECTERMKYVTYTTRARKNMIGWLIEDMKLHAALTLPNEAYELRNLSQSEYINKG